MKWARVLCGLAALSALLLARDARADETEAERLFREGRALMLQGQFASACPKIAESNLLEPHVGTLLNLAACHERLGRVATAWVELQKALTAAHAEGQADRERFARERIAALEPRVPWLTIAAPLPAVEGLVITLDGGTVQPIALDKAMPVDPGDHVVLATGASRRSYEVRFELHEAERRTVTIPAELPDVPDVLVEQPPAAPPAAPRPARKSFVPAYASLFYPASTNYDEPYAATRFGFDLLYGRAGELDGGLQLGTVNLVIGKDGVASGDMSGVQLTPFIGFNYASGHASGLQIGTVGNAVGRGLEGGQVTFGANVTAGDLDGLQLAMVANVATGTLRGFQLSAVNVAGDVGGVQIGFVNVAKRFEGLAVGLINVADDIDGVPIGLLSVTKTGGVHPVFWSSTATYANVGLKFATKHTYTMVAGHYTNVAGADYAATSSRPETHLEQRDFMGGGFFIGGHVPVDGAFIDFDIGVSGLSALSSATRIRDDGRPRSYREVLVDPRIRVLGGYSFAKHASLFGGVGAGARGRIVNDGADVIFRFSPELFGGVQF